MIKHLLAIPSISGNELAIQKWIARHLTHLGHKPVWINGNVIVHISCQNHVNALIFNTHVDTVPAGDVHKWSSNPFCETFVGDKIYGLGASDEKAAIAVLLMLAQRYAKEKPPCDIFLTFVVREEIDGSGTRDVMQWFGSNFKNKYQSFAGILGEPTDLNTVEIGHKGNIFIKLTTTGNSGHGSRPDKIKQHAVYKMYQASKILGELVKSWGTKYYDSVLGMPTIGLLTTIQAGDLKSPNKFADSCIGTFDIRTTPKLHHLAFAMLKKKIGSLAKVETMYDPVPYGLTSPKEVIIKIVQSITKAHASVSDGSNDMCFFTQLGIPAVVFGPGTKACIHKPNEYCLASNIGKCFSFYVNIVHAFANI